MTKHAPDKPPIAGALSVLLVNSLYSPFRVGGAELVTELLATTLARQGHRVTVVTSCSRQDGSSLETRDGVQIHRFFPPNLWWLHERFTAGDTRSRCAKLSWRIRDCWNSAAGRRFAEIVDRLRPDVVHTHNIKGFSPILWSIARRRRIPVVHTAHSYELICTSGLLLDAQNRACPPGARCGACRVQGRWYGAQARSIDVFCSPSKYLLQAHWEAGLPIRHGAVVRNGTARTGASSSSHRRQGEPVRFLYLGQLARHKGLHVLAEAVRRCSSPFRIDLAGDGEAAGAVRALAMSDARVHYHGFVDGERKRELLLDADALIFPSIWVENAPMSVIEALCQGVPVIASDIGATAELVEHGANGLLFRAGDAQALAEVMQAFCGSIERRQTLQRRAALAGATMPTPEMMTAEYFEIYRSLLVSGRTGGGQQRRRLETASALLAAGGQA